MPRRGAAPSRRETPRSEGPPRGRATHLPASPDCPDRASARALATLPPTADQRRPGESRRALAPRSPRSRHREWGEREMRARATKSPAPRSRPRPSLPCAGTSTRCRRPPPRTAAARLEHARPCRCARPVPPPPVSRRDARGRSRRRDAEELERGAASLAVGRRSPPARTCSLDVAAPERSRELNRAMESSFFEATSFISPRYAGARRRQRLPDAADSALATPQDVQLAGVLRSSRVEFRRRGDAARNRDIDNSVSRGPPEGAKGRRSSYVHAKMRRPAVGAALQACSSSRDPRGSRVETEATRDRPWFDRPPSTQRDAWTSRRGSSTTAASTTARASAPTRRRRSAGASTVLPSDHSGVNRAARARRPRRRRRATTSATSDDGEYEAGQAAADNRRRGRQGPHAAPESATDDMSDVNGNHYDPALRRRHRPGGN